jgi:hypothetical protein
MTTAWHTGHKTRHREPWFPQGVAICQNSHKAPTKQSVSVKRDVIRLQLLITPCLCRQIFCAPRATRMPLMNMFAAPFKIILFQPLSFGSNGSQ